MYEITELRDVEIEVPNETVNADGQKVVTYTKDKSKKPVKFFLAKPTRAQKDDADLFYGAEYGHAVQKGMIPFALLQKRFINDDGILPEKDKERATALIFELTEKESEYQRLKLVKEDNVSDEDKAKEKEIVSRLKGIREELQKIQSHENSLYNNTPEIWARNKAIIWYLLHLSWMEEDGKDIELFPGKSYKEKLESYDLLDDKNDQFITKGVTQLLLAISIFYSTGVSTQDALATIVNDITKDVDKVEPETKP